MSEKSLSAPLQFLRKTGKTPRLCCEWVTLVWIYGMLTGLLQCIYKYLSVKMLSGVWLQAAMLGLGLKQRKLWYKNSYYSIFIHEQKFSINLNIVGFDLFHLWDYFIAQDTGKVDIFTMQIKSFIKIMLLVTFPECSFHNTQKRSHFSCGANWTYFHHKFWSSCCRTAIFMLWFCF